MRDLGTGGSCIGDLNPGQRVDGMYGVAGKRLRSFRDPSKGCYLELDIRDVSGLMPGRIWDDADQVADKFQVGDVIQVQGEVTQYRGENQMIITDLQVVPPEQVSVERFIPKSPRPFREMEEELWHRIESVRCPHLSQLLFGIFDTQVMYSVFTTAPAAKKVHHNYLHGLLEHSLEVVEVLVDAGPRDRMNADLLIAGGLLHDIGKTEELVWHGAINYTQEGRLLGHVTMGSRFVRDRVAGTDGFPGDLGLHLEHMVLSHHGRLEYGSPVLPQTREAVALHHADLYSGKVGQVISTSAGLRGSQGGWSEFDPLMGRYIWMPSEQQGTEEDA